ncbi:MAG TPA: transposase [Sphingobacteriaceae bacterium]
METKESFIKRANKQEVFDPRLIKEIVRSIEEGLPRKAAIAQYGMSQSALNNWMKTYGSSDYHSSKRRTFSPSEKRSVLRALASGMTTREVQISFGIKNPGIIRAWYRAAQQENAELSLSNFNSSMAKQSTTAPTDELKALQEALAQAELKIKALDTMIDIAEEQLKINIRKKSGARQSLK